MAFDAVPDPGDRDAAPSVPSSVVPSTSGRLLASQSDRARPAGAEMRASDRAIIIGVASSALAVAFYVLVLGPKRDQASELGTRSTSCMPRSPQQQQVANFGEQARQDFPRYYGRLVVLGKAVPPRRIRPRCSSS